MSTATARLVRDWCPFVLGGKGDASNDRLADASQELTRALQEIVELRTTALNASETKAREIVHMSASLEHSKEMLRDALSRLQQTESCPPQRRGSEASLSHNEDDKLTAAAIRRLHVREFCLFFRLAYRGGNVWTHAGGTVTVVYPAHKASQTVR
jgi:hypothetical protein